MLAEVDLDKFLDISPLERVIPQMRGVSIYPGDCSNATVGSGHEITTVDASVIQSSASDTKDSNLIVCSDVESSGASLLNGSISENFRDAYTALPHALL